ncbi:hypothetical protein LTR53_009709 [Teratosphaeriaceae sp. CCFEE 6253]|nr:hypothetical protein LTR53_009709 [Teratosphaeriaceae sp. CCFEE 6253]
MWRTTFTNEVMTPVPQDVSPETLIKLLHDHSFLITMSPIVTRHQEVDRELMSNKITYDVWEVLDLLPFGLWKHEIQFRCAFANKPDGVVSWIEAPMGFTSRAEYSVGSGGAWEGGGDVLEEAIESDDGAGEEEDACADYCEGKRDGAGRGELIEAVGAVVRAVMVVGCVSLALVHPWGACTRACGCNG